MKRWMMAVVRLVALAMVLWLAAAVSTHEVPESWAGLIGFVLLVVVVSLRPTTSTVLLAAAYHGILTVVRWVAPDLVPAFAEHIGSAALLYLWLFLWVKITELWEPYLDRYIHRRDDTYTERQPD